MAKPTRVEGLRPRTPLRAAGLELLLARLADVRKFESRFEDGFDVDDVHDMRVATRRLRAALVMFAGGKLKKLEPRVKALQDALGELRDVHVMRDWIAEQHPRAEADRKLLHAFAAELKAKEGPAQERLRAALERWIRKDVLDLVTHLDDVHTKGRLDGKRTHQVLKRAVDRVRERRDETLVHADAPTFHALRKAAKKLRYLGELAEGAMPGPLEKEVGEVTELQEPLGDLHDLDVRIDRLHALGDAPIVHRLVHERERRAKPLVATLDQLDLG